MRNSLVEVSFRRIKLSLCCTSGWSITLIGTLRSSAFAANVGNAGDLYQRTKRELAKQTWKHVQNYADAKTSIVAEIVARARAARLDRK